MKQEQWLVNYIELAFTDVTLGDGIDIYAAQSLDDYGNPKEDLLSLTAEREDWRRVPDYDLITRFWAVTFLDALGFRFYTPAIMRLMLLPDGDSGGCLTSWFLMHLSVSEDGLIKGVHFNSLFSSRQRAAIIRFLKFLIHHRVDCEGCEPSRRLSEIQTWTSG